MKTASYMTLLAFLVVFLDQLTKSMITAWLSLGEVVPVVQGFFNLTLVLNKGAAFGIMGGLPDYLRQVLLIVTTTGALVVVLYFMLREYRSDKFGQMALALILGGAIGNIIDRLRVGAVIDFLDFYFRGLHWPAFNVADSAICVGVFLLLIHRPIKDSRSQG